MVVNSTEELLGIIRKNDIAIYGIGYVAERFYDSLILHGCKDNIKCFITTKKKVNQYKGLQVLSLNEYKKKKEFLNYLICIAVHESILAEITCELEKVDINNYIWIHPFQHELRFGQPIVIAKEIELSKIIDKIRNDYRLAIRLLAIDQFYGKNSCGYDIYIKTQSLHCETNTAKKRLDNFIDLISNWELNGYDIMSRPEITDNCEIIDGAHRIALAVYKGMKTIPCDIYHSDLGKEYRNDEVDITQAVISKAGLTEYEMTQVIEKANTYVC